MPYTCSICGEEHDDLPHIGAAAPAYWAEKLVNDPQSLLTEDLCIPICNLQFAIPRSSRREQAHPSVFSVLSCSTQFRFAPSLLICIIHS
jgi:hypothetical protein